MDIIKKLQRKLAWMTLTGFLIVPNVLSVKAQEEDNAGYTELVSAPVEEISELITENEENQDVSRDLVDTNYSVSNDQSIENETRVSESEFEDFVSEEKADEIDRISSLIKSLTENLNEDDIKRQQEEVERMRANHSPAPYYNYINIYGDKRPAPTKQVLFQKTHGQLIYDLNKGNKEILTSVMLSVVGENLKWDFTVSEEKVKSEYEKVKRDLGILLKKKHIKSGDLSDMVAWSNRILVDYYKKDKGKISSLNDIYKLNDLSKFDKDEMPELTTIYDRLLGIAFSYVGVPYVWGGKTPYGFDCSGYVSQVFGELGYYVPAYTVDAEDYGYQVGLDELKVGDLLFFGDYGQTDHIAIYIGGNQYIHSSTINGGVGIYTLDGFSPHFARRIIN